MAHLIETALDKAQTSWQIYIIYISLPLSHVQPSVTVVAVVVAAAT